MKRKIVDLPPELERELNAYCSKTGATVVGAIRIALRDFLDGQNDRHTSRFLVNLPEDLALDLSAFQETCAFGAPRNNVVLKAIPDYMETYLTNNPRLRPVFEAAREELRQKGAHTIRLISSREE